MSIKTKTPTKVHAIQCKKCGDTVYSRARHDFRECTCKGVFIDGGFDYVRAGHKDEIEYAMIDVDIFASKGDLYNDWNNSFDKFGIIKKGA